MANKTFIVQASLTIITCHRSKGLPGTNALTYYEKSLLTAIKFFITLATERDKHSSLSGAASATTETSFNGRFIGFSARSVKLIKEHQRRNVITQGILTEGEGSVRLTSLF
jgi:hypothetical protein